MYNKTNIMRYWVVTTQMYERGCEVMSFGTEEEVLNFVNNNTTDDIELIIKGETFELEKIEVVTKYKLKKQ